MIMITMSKPYFIYTVTGGHEVYYAAVDRETGRVWTAPTKEVCHKQAREAGFDTFTERVISKENLLESLGIHDDHAMRIEAAKPAPIEKSPPSRTPWFVAGDGNADAPMPKLPRMSSMKGSRKSGRGSAGRSPFAANEPIAPVGSKQEGTDDDVLIVPAPHDSSAPRTPFTDKPAGGANEPEE
jgi:hypothetical protein